MSSDGMMSSERKPTSEKQMSSERKLSSDECHEKPGTVSETSTACHLSPVAKDATNTAGSRFPVSPVSKDSNVPSSRLSFSIDSILSTPFKASPKAHNVVGLESSTKHDQRYSKVDACNDANAKDISRCGVATDLEKRDIDVEIDVTSDEDDTIAGDFGNRIDKDSSDERVDDKDNRMDDNIDVERDTERKCTHKTTLNTTSRLPGLVHAPASTDLTCQHRFGTEPHPGRKTMYGSDQLTNINSPYRKFTAGFPAPSAAFGAPVHDIPGMDMCHALDYR